MAARGRRVFVIRELRRTGAGVIEPTQVVFRWRPEDHAAPVGDLPLHLQVKTVREEVPGGVDVVEQVVSVAWQPFRIRGLWSDTWGGSGFAMFQFDAFRRLVERAPLVEVEFEGLKLRGLITDFQPTYRRAERIGWEVTISPHRFAEGAARVGFGLRPRAIPMSAHVDGLEQRLAELVELRDAALGRTGLRPIPLREESLLDAVRDGIGRVQEQIARARTAATGGFGGDAVQTLLSLASTFRSVRDTSHALALSLVRTRSGLQVAFDSATESLAFTRWTLGTRRVALAAVRDSGRAERDARALARQRPRAIHRPAGGESLYQISLRYYGTAAEWRRIYEFNRLQSLRMEGTEELIIPERAP